MITSTTVRLYITRESLKFISCMVEEIDYYRSFPEYLSKSVKSFSLTEPYTHEKFQNLWRAITNYVKSAVNVLQVLSVCDIFSRLLGIG